MRLFVQSVVVAASLVGLASPAIAEEVTVTVSYADLDLTSSADLATLHDRLAAALRDACSKNINHKRAALQVSADCVASGLANGDKVISEHRERALAAQP